MHSPFLPLPDNAPPLQPSRGLLVVLLMAASMAGGCYRRGIDPPARSKPDSSALFEEIGERAGIHFVHKNGASGKFYNIEFSPPGCAVFDFDNDGWLDILLIQSGSSDPPRAGASAEMRQTSPPRPYCQLYRNTHDGKFANVTAGSGIDRDLGYAQGAAVGDYDNDGYSDVFVTAYGGNHLFHNEGAHRQAMPYFREVTATVGLNGRHSTGFATSAAFGDYDNDGRLDLYICYYSPWTWSSELVCRGPGGTRDYCTPEVYAPDTHQLFHNEGARFRDVSTESRIASGKGRGLAVAFIDYDQDGRQDIYVANDMGDAFLWHNDGNGKFTDRALEAGVARSEGARRVAGMGIAIGDYDHTGRQSLFVTNFADLPNVLFRNRGGGQFDDLSANSGVGPAHGKLLSFGCEFLDYDLDGWPDIVTANGHVISHIDSISGGASYAQPKQLLHNERNGTFRAVVDDRLLGPLSRPMISRGLAVGDFDNDGRPDVLAANQNDEPQLFRNAYAGPNHWITLKLIGTASNRDALHALVKMDAGGVVQTSVVRAGSSYLSHSDTRLMFGLGLSEMIDRLDISWPSGTRTTLRKVAVDRVITIREGRSTIE